MKNRNRARRVSLSGLVFALLLGGCGSPPLAGGAPTPAAMPVQVQGSLVVKGRLYPQHVAALSFDASGTLAEVRTQVGDTLPAGGVIARLASSADHDTDVTRAQKAANVAAAQQAVTAAALEVAASQQAQLAAQTEVVNARKALTDSVDASATGVNLAQAQANIAGLKKQIDDAQRNLGYLTSPDLKYYQDQVKHAQDGLTNAQQNATLVDISQLQVNLRNAQKQLETATNVYNNAQDAFAKCPACITVFAYDRKITWQDAQNLYTDATNQVQQIQTQIDQAQRGTTLSVSDAQTNLDDATHRLNYFLQGPDAIKVNQAQANIALMQAQVVKAQSDADKLQANGVDPDKFKAAQDRVAAAAAGLVSAQARLADAQTAVTAAQASLAMAQAQLKPAGIELKAPFAGTLTMQNLEVGQQVAAGQAVVTFADLSLWEVRTEDLTELNVAQLQEGQAVTLRFDALPAVTLTGVVRTINPQYVNVSGDIDYVVYINLTSSDPHLRWGMTAQVEFGI